MCVCVCVRERERETQRERDREILCVKLIVTCYGNVINFKKYKGTIVLLATQINYRGAAVEVLK